MTIERIKSGVPDLDRMMQGGFEKNSAVLLCGGGGSGKSIFGCQFLIEGIKNNETGIYISFEEKKEKFYQHMEGFGWDLQKLEAEGKFVFIRYTPKKMLEIVKQGGKDLKQAVADLNAGRIVIDSLSAYAALFSTEHEEHEMLVSLFEMVADWECTSIVIAEDEKAIDDRKSTVMGFMADSIIYLYELIRDEKMERALQIVKMRGTKHDYRIVPMKIDSKGVSVHSHETFL